MMTKKLTYFFLSILMLSCSPSVQAYPNTIQPFPPFHIAGNLYYVGDHYQADYLIVTSQGNILINSGYKTNVPLIKNSIEKLGFKFSDIKIILVNHAHSDHAGGSALIKKETHAKYMIMGADVSVVESGGKAENYSRL